MEQVWINGKKLDIAQDNCINSADRGFTYGDGLFATMRVKQSKVLFLAEHLARLEQGAKRLGFNWSISAATKAAISTATGERPNACIKLVVTRGIGGRGYAAPQISHPTEVLSIQKLPVHYVKWQQQGIALAFSDLHLAKQPRLAGIKHLNRLEQVLIKSQQQPQWADDVLVTDFDQHIIEASMANVFAVYGKEVVTPSITHSGVAGIMRTQVINALIEMGFNIRMKPMSKPELLAADHLFLSNSLFGVIDIIRVENLRFAPSTLAADLRLALDVCYE